MLPIRVFFAVFPARIPASGLLVSKIRFFKKNPAKKRKSAET